MPKPTLLPPGHSLSSKPSSFKRQCPASVNSLHVEFSDGSAIDIPPDASSEDQHIANRYTVAVHAIQADPRKFSSSSECAICEGTSHSFADCEVLKDIDFLKKHYNITYCVNQQRLKKMLTNQATVHALHAAINDEKRPDRDTAPAAPDF